jgi:hypothetical protein
MLRPLLAALATALVLAAPAKAASYDDDNYWAFADRMQQRVEDRWDEQAGYFRFAAGGVEPMANSMQLLTYSVAAVQAHQGPARNDRRARILADRLVSQAPLVTKRTGTGPEGRRRARHPASRAELRSEARPDARDPGRPRAALQPLRAVRSPHARP